MKTGDKKKVVFWAVILIVLLIIGGCYYSISNKLINHNSGEGSVAIANPASAYCINNGGKFSIVADKDGNQQGMCTLSEGTLCDEWAYFKGECGNSSANECNTDDNCVPASCCHADSCVPKQNALNCSRVFCTQVCIKNTLDCGQGHCGCVNNKCAIESIK
jgi:putative hemolysin